MFRRAGPDQVSRVGRIKSNRKKAQSSSKMYKYPLRLNVEMGDSGEHL